MKTIVYFNDDTSLEVLGKVETANDDEVYVMGTEKYSYIIRKVGVKYIKLVK